MIEVNNISFSYAGSRTEVFSHFDVSLAGSRVYGLLGRNGTGKSTLLYLLSGLLRPTQGSVAIDGQDPAKRRAELLSNMFLVSAEFTLPPITLHEYVGLYSAFYPQFSHDVLHNCLQAFGLTDDVHLARLSMGQKKKVFMSFALASQTRYLLMDEPTNGLDIPSKSQFRRVIAENMQSGRTVIISTHQVHDVEQLLDHILILDNRAILLNASVADIARDYTFSYRLPGETDSSVLYAEPTLQGNATVARRSEGEEETQLNLELLFNYITKAEQI